MNGEPNRLDLMDGRIHSGQTVRTSDGQKLGKVQGCAADYVMVSGGKIFWAKIYYVPLADVQSVNRNVVLLSVPRNDPSLQDWLTPPLFDELTSTPSDVEENASREEPAPLTPEPDNHAGADAPTMTPPITAETVAESPAPENPEIRKPGQEYSPETMPVTQVQDEEAEQSTEDSTGPSSPEPKPHTSTYAEVAPASTHDVTKAVKPAELAPEPKPAISTIAPESMPIGDSTRKQSPIPAPPPVAPASPTPVSAAAVDKEIDQRIEELKRKLGISMRNAENADASSRVAAPGNLPVRHAPPAQASSERASFSEDHKQAPAGGSRSQASQIAADAESAASGTLTNARNHAKAWTSASGEAAERTGANHPDDLPARSPRQHSAQDEA